jgi:hypothetical protein
VNEQTSESIERRVKRRTWLIATVTALFVLQVPLCALACFELAGTGPTAISEHPCHEGNPDSSPASESNSHDNCGCKLAPEAPVSQISESNTTTAPVGIFVSAKQLTELTNSARRHTPRVKQGADLPPPDILLLKSTLII